MPKGLSISGMVVAGCMLLVFGLDLALKVPFGRILPMDIGFVISAAVLGYMSWNTVRELP